MIRAIRGRNPQAEEWLAYVCRGEVQGIVPDLAFAEVGNAFLVENRVRGMPASEVVIALDRLRDIPLAVVSTKELIRDAVAIAFARDLSAYDACYVALAEANDAVLVTADSKLAAATNRAELILD